MIYEAKESMTLDMFYKCNVICTIIRIILTVLQRCFRTNNKLSSNNMDETR